MYSEKEIFLKTIRGEKTDRLASDYDALGVVRRDPIADLDRGIRVEGTNIKDIFGTEIIWPVGQKAGMPHVTEENKVIRDVTNWKNEVTIPDFASMDLDWSLNREMCASINREEKLLTSIMATGLFERLHFLMGFEDTLMNFLLEPEAMHELLDALTEARLQYLTLLIDNMKPDVIIHHDDWGNKASLFMQSDTWREFFKERYRKLYSYVRSRGVILIHHADCHCADIIEDMVDIGVQAWQGAIPENDIVSMQKKLDGRMVIMGGIDAVIDKPDWNEAEVRAEVRRACETYGPHGGYIPCMTYGGPGCLYAGVSDIIRDEIARYNQETSA